MDSLKQIGKSNTAPFETTLVLSFFLKIDWPVPSQIIHGKRTTCIFKTRLRALVG